jgi:hypothetical protein
MEPRREQLKTSTLNSGEHTKPVERIAQAVMRVRPFRIEQLEDRIAPVHCTAAVNKA